MGAEEPPLRGGSYILSIHGVVQMRRESIVDAFFSWWVLFGMSEMAMISV